MSTLVETLAAPVVNPPNPSHKDKVLYPTPNYVGYRNFYGTGAEKYFIYPDDSWKKSWGRKPLLGVVYADDPFYAEREAYTKGLAPVNFSFGLMAVTEKLPLVKTNRSSGMTTKNRSN